MIDSLKWIKSEMKTIYSVISVRVVLIGHEVLSKKDSTKYPMWFGKRGDEYF